MQEFEFPESPKPAPPDLPKIPKNDTTNRFWATVEPYCADITADDLKFLEDLIHQHEDNADLYKVPSLGKHFAEKWAAEDMLEEQKEGGIGRRYNIYIRNVHETLCLDTKITFL